MKLIVFFTSLMLSMFCLASEVSTSHKPEFTGEWSQGGILFGKTEPGIKVEFMGK